MLSILSRSRGLDAFRKEIVSVSPFLLGAIDEIDDWQKVKLLTVQVNRRRRWYPSGITFHRRRRSPTARAAAQIWRRQPPRILDLSIASNLRLLGAPTFQKKKTCRK